MPRKRQANLVGSRWGQLVTKPADEYTVKMVAAGWSAEAMEWKPNRRVLKYVPSDFRLPLQLIAGPDGVRRIVPGCGIGPFLLLAAIGGLAVMQRLKGLTMDQRQSYRLMSLLFQWSFSDRRLMSRTIRRGEDLRLRQSERSHDSERDILPDIETTNHRGKPARLTAAELLRCGRESARDRGISLEYAESVSLQIMHGLLKMAYGSPDLTKGFHPQDTAATIRLCLFGMDQGEPTNDTTLKALVEERMLQAVGKHLHLPDEKFRNWMWKDFDNFVQQLAKRKQGGPVKRQQVRYILLDLLWRSFGYVSGCVQLQMQAVRLAIEPALSERERKDFGFWYDAQPWVADLAPIVLHSRFGLLAPTLSDLNRCDAADERPWRAFLQAMQWSTEMTEKRRSADLTQKHGTGVRSSSARDDGLIDDDEDDDLIDEDDESEVWISRPVSHQARSPRRRGRK